MQLVRHRADCWAWAQFKWTKHQILLFYLHNCNLVRFDFVTWKNAIDSVVLKRVSDGSFKLNYSIICIMSFDRCI